MKKYWELILLFLIVVITGITILYLASYKSALHLFHSGKYSFVQKISTYNIKIAKEKSSWYSLRAFANFKLKNYTKAIEDFDKAYLLASDDFGVMNFDNKIFVKYFLKDYQGAIKDFDNEIKNSKDDELKDSFLWDKAQFLYNIGKFKDALEIYTRLIKRSDSDFVYLIKNRLYYERSLVYDKLGYKINAQNDRKQAKELDLDPSYEKPIPKPNLLLDEMKF